MKKEAVQREIQKYFRVKLSVVSYRCNKCSAHLSEKPYQQFNCADLSCLQCRTCK